MSKRTKAIIISAAVLVAVLAISGTALADDGFPPFPSFYSGTVYVGGSQAGAGLSITTSILDWTTEAGYEGITDENGYYELAVAPTDTPYVNEIIHFYVNGVQADETATFKADQEVTNFNLHVDEIPPYTITPGPTSDNVTTPTPSPTGGTTTPAEPTSTAPAASTTPRATPTATSTPPPTPGGEGGLGWGVGAGIAAVALVLGVVTALMLNRMSARKRARRRKKSPPPQQ